MYEILLDYSTNGGDWKKAFYKVLPPRKLKSTSNADVETENHNTPVNQPPSENLASTEIDTNIVKVELSSSSECNNDLPEDVNKSSDSLMPSEGVLSEGVPSGGAPCEGVPCEGVPSGGVPCEGVPSGGVPCEGGLKEI